MLNLSKDLVFLFEKYLKDNWSINFYVWAILKELGELSLNSVENPVL